MTKPYVLDASALIQLIDDSHDGGEHMERLLQDAVHRKIPLVMSVVNWGEVFYQIWQRSGEEKARQTIGNLSRLPLDLVPVDLFQVLKVGEIRAVHKIPHYELSRCRPGGDSSGHLSYIRPRLRKTWAPGGGLMARALVKDYSSELRSAGQLGHRPYAVHRCLDTSSG